jgi:hypothetical protein
MEQLLEPQVNKLTLKNSIFLCFKEQHIENTLLFEFVTLLKVLVCEPCENATANFKTYHIFGQLKYTVIRRN